MIGCSNIFESKFEARLAWLAMQGSTMSLSRRFTHAPELSAARPGFLAKWSLLCKLPAVAYPC